MNNAYDHIDLLCRPEVALKRAKDIFSMMIISTGAAEVHVGTVDGSVAVVDSVVATMVATAVVVPSGVVATRVGVHTHGDVLEQPAGPVCCLLVRVGGQTGGQASQQHL